MRRWFLDFEFNEDGSTIDPIAIGLIDESGLNGYYAHFAEYDPSACNLWVKQHVLPKVAHMRRTPKAQIAKDIVEVVGARPEFWAYYADYDWIVMCQLYGTMMDLPEHWPRYCNDLKQEMARLGVTRDDIEHGIEQEQQLIEPAHHREQLIEHHAMDDAKWCRLGLLWIKKEFPKTWHGATVPMGDTW